MRLGKFFIAVTSALVPSYVLAQSTTHHSGAFYEDPAPARACIFDPTDSSANLRSDDLSVGADGKVSSSKVCAVNNGTKIEILYVNQLMDTKNRTWTKVRVLEGTCKGQEGWVLERSIDRRCGSSESPPKSNKDSSALTYSKAKDVFPSRPAIDKNWLSGKALKLSNPKPASNGVKLVIPKDRCKAGLIVFGNTACFALARGGSRVKPQTQGTRSDGSSCNYPAETVSNGSLPIKPPPKVTLVQDAVMLPSKSYGTTATIRMFPDGGSWPSGRSGILIHAGGQNLNMSSIEGRNTFGCLRLDESCQTELLKYLRDNPKANVMEMDDSSLDDVEMLKAAGPFEGYAP